MSKDKKYIIELYDPCCSEGRLYFVDEDLYKQAGLIGQNAYDSEEGEQLIQEVYSRGIRVTPDATLLTNP